MENNQFDNLPEMDTSGMQSGSFNDVSSQKQNYLDAMKFPPVEVAKAKTNAGKLDIEPVDALDNQEITDYAANQPDWEQMMQDSPKLTRALADPSVMAIARENISQLAEIEKINKEKNKKREWHETKVGTSIAHGAYSFANSTAISTAADYLDKPLETEEDAQNFQRTIGTAWAELEVYRQRHPELTRAKAYDQWRREKMAALTNTPEWVDEFQKNQNYIEKVVSSIVGSSPSTAAMMFPGGKIVGAQMIYDQAFGGALKGYLSEYEYERSQGKNEYTDDEIMKLSKKTARIEALISTPMEFAQNFIKVKAMKNVFVNSAFKRYLKMVVAESVGEGAVEVAQNIFTSISRTMAEGGSIEQMINDMKESATSKDTWEGGLVAMGAGGAMVTTSAAAGKISKPLIDNARRKKSAKEYNDYIQKLEEAVETGDLQDIAPEDFKNFVEELSDGNDEVYMQADILQDILDESGMSAEDIAANLGIEVEDLNDALESGGDVALSIGSVLAMSKENGIAPFIKNHLKPSPEASDLSLVDAETEAELSLEQREQAKLQRAEGRKLATEQRRALQERFKNQVKELRGQLAEAYKDKKVIKAFSDILIARAETWASRNGKHASEYLDRFGLQINARAEMSDVAKSSMENVTDETEISIPVVRANGETETISVGAKTALTQTDAAVNGVQSVIDGKADISSLSQALTGFVNGAASRMVESGVDADTAQTNALIAVLEQLTNQRQDVINAIAAANDVGTMYDTETEAEANADDTYFQTMSELDGIQKEAVDKYLESKPELAAKLKEFEGTAWEKQTVESIMIRIDVDILIATGNPDNLIGSKLATSSQLDKARETIAKYGVEGIKSRLEGSLIGSAAKPVNNVNASLIDCNPSKDCAKYCYATKNNYGYPIPMLKSELVTFMVETDPEWVAKRLEREYKVTPEFELGKALRLFDKGDMTEDWIPIILKLKEKGIYTQIFSKHPDLLRKLKDSGYDGVAMLSIDMTNTDLSRENPDLPVAFVYDGTEESIGFLESIKDIYLDKGGVVLPVRIGVKDLSPEKIALLPDWVKKEGYLCPVNSTGKKLKTKDNIDGWVCTKCDKHGGLGCFKGNATQNLIKLGKMEQKITEREREDIEKRIKDLETALAVLPEGELSKSLREEKSILAAQIRAGHDPETDGVESPANSEGNTADNGRSRTVSDRQTQYESVSEQLSLDIGEQQEFSFTEVSTESDVQQSAELQKGYEGLASRGIVVANAISQELNTKGQVSIIGQKVNTSRDLATLATVYRSASFETFRVFYMKDGVVVGQTAVTARLPGVTPIFESAKDNDVTGRERMTNDMLALGADGYWILHNHPSGKVNPSPEDISVTKGLATDIPGMLGHVIINHNKYTLLTSNNDADGVTGEEHTFDSGAGDEIHNASVPHEILGKDVKESADLVAFGKSLEIQDGYFSIISVSNDGVRGVLELPVSSLNQPQKLQAIVRRFALQTGGLSMFGVVPSEMRSKEQVDIAKRAVSYGFLRDIVYMDGHSIQELGVFGTAGFYFGRKIVGKKVQEGETEWETKDESPDPRLFHPVYREGILPFFESQTFAGGGQGKIGSVIMGDNGEVLGRVGSSNPDWAQEIIKLVGSREKAINAIKKATDGKQNLGKNQRIAVELALDAFQVEYEKYLDEQENQPAYEPESVEVDFETGETIVPEKTEPAPEEVPAEKPKKPVVVPEVTPTPEAVNRGAIDLSGDSQAIISLFEKKNASTIFHELGHFFLNDLKISSKDGTADREMLNRVLDFLEVDSFEAIKKPQHEKFARAFEAYLREGKSPSRKLNTTMFRLREWLTAIYRSVRNLDVKINPEIKYVFDRMLATDAQIKEERTQSAMIEMFDLAEDTEGMTPEERKKYAETVQQTIEDAYSEITRDKNREMFKKMNLIREQAKKEIEEDRAYQGLHKIRFGRTPDAPVVKGQKGSGISILSFMEAFGKSAYKQTRKMNGLYAKEGGISIEMAKDMVGAKDYEELLEILQGVKSKAEMMQEKIDHILAKKDAETEIADKTRNSAYEAQLEMESTFLAKKANGDKKATSKGALKDWAVKRVSEEPIKKATDTNKLLLAIARIRKRALKEQRAGNSDLAFDLNEQVRRTEALLREHIKVKEQLAKMQRAWKGKVQSKSIKDEWRNQVRQLANKFSLVGKELELNEDTESLVFFLNARQAEMHEIGTDIPAFSDFILDAEKTEMADLTWGQLQEIDNAFKYLVAQGVTEKKAKLKEDGLLLDDVVEATVAEMQKNKRSKKVHKKGSIIRGITNATRKYFAENDQLQFILEKLDNYAEGANIKFIWNRLSRANDKKVELSERVVAAMKPHINHLRKRSKDIGKKIFTHFPTPAAMSENGDGWTYEHIISAALNMGNPENILRFVDGYNLVQNEEVEYAGAGLKGKEKAEAIRAAKVELGRQRMLELTAVLTVEDIQAVQGMTDVIESLWSDIDAVHYNINDFHQTKVKAEAITYPAQEAYVIDGIEIPAREEITVPGGYYPAKYDPELADKVKEFNETEDLMQSTEAIFQTPATKSNFLKSRGATGGGMPLKLSFSVLSEHLRDTVHYISHAEAVHDVYKIIKDSRWKNEAKRIVGTEGYESVRATLIRAARPESKPTTAIERYFKKHRGLATAYILAWNFGVAVKQPFSVTGMMFDMNPASIITGYIRAAGNPVKLYTEVNNLSAYMRGRADGIDRDMTKDLMRIKPGGFNIAGKDAQDIRDMGFVLIKTMDFATVYPAWMTAYKQASKTMEMEEAVQFADNFISKSQPTSRPIDLSFFQGSTNGLHILFTMFSGFTAKYANRKRYYYNKYRAGEMGTGNFLWHNALEAIAPPIVMSMMMKALSGSDEEREWDYYAVEALMYQTIGLPLVNELVPLMLTGGDFGKSFGDSPAYQHGNIFINIGKKARGVNEYRDQQAIEELVWSFAKLISYSTGVPFAKVIDRARKGMENMTYDDGTPLNIVFPNYD